MLAGRRPKGCSYCWNIEDSGNYSDRHYRSLEPWAKSRFQEVIEGGANQDIIPSYVEVNFNQACQFKCSYCSPHLSTAWEHEIKEHGPYPTLKRHNDIKSLQKKGLYPLPLGEPNPYVEAFWKWWPQLYPRLKVFRMTGGEPLIDHNTYRVLKYIQQHPHPELELAITSNLCPPPKMMARFKTHLQKIFAEKKIHRFMLFPSIDGWGRHAEYIRFGLKTAEFEKNIRMLIKEAPEVLISFIVTVNALSPFSLKNLLVKILEWQKEAFYIHQHKWRRIFLDLPILRSPPWQALDVLPEGLAVKEFKICLDFMEKNKIDFAQGKFYGFSDFGINKMKRIIDIAKKTPPQAVLEEKRVNFFRFFNSHDKRRGTNFTDTFLELKSFYGQCRKLSQKYKPIKNKLKFWPQALRPDGF